MYVKSGRCWKSLKRRYKVPIFESKVHRRLLSITYKQSYINIYVSTEIRRKIGNYKPLLDTVERRKMNLFGHISRHELLAKIILQGSIEGSKKKGLPKRN